MAVFRFRAAAALEARRRQEDDALAECARKDGLKRAADARCEQIETDRRGAAAALIEPGDSVALDIGSTTFELARNLVDRSGLTVISPSLRIIQLLLGTPGIRLIVPGGIVRPGEGSLVGELARQGFGELFVDKLFLAVGGLDAQSGLTEYNWEDALVKRAMIRSAREVVLVADAGKFGRTAFARIAGLAAVHALVTDRDPPEPLRRSLEAAGVRIIVAPS